MSPIEDAEMATAGKEELEEALQLQGRVFGLSADYFRTLAAKDPLFDRENVFVAKVDGKVVSHVQVFPKLVRLAGAQVWMGGIGGVATDPDYRGKGLASELLKMAIGSMKRRGMETSVLFTGIQDFYRRLGWEVASGINRYTLSVDKAPSEVPGYSTRPFSREDLGAVASIYEEQNANRSLSVIRSEEIWDLQLRHPQAPAPPEDLEGFTVAEREGDVVGYARMGSSPEEDCVILESGCRRDHERALEACVGRLSERAKSLGHGQLTTVVPEDHPLALVMRRVGASREYAHTSGMMFKVVDPLECLLRIEDGLSKRAMESHASRIKLELLVGDESMSIEVAPGCVRVGREHNLPERFKTTEIGFARMMSGFSLPSELVRSGEASCTAGASGPMDLLFPKQLSHMYSPDFF